MGDYNFFMANAVAILLIAAGMGLMGGAEHFTNKDVVIGNADDLIANGVVENSSQVDFDTERLLYRPDTSQLKPPVSGREEGFAWTGATNDRNEEYGYLQYDVSNIEGEQTVYYETTSIIFRQIDFYGDGENILSEPRSDVINNGAVYDLTGIDTFEVRLVSESATFIGFETDKISSTDFASSSTIERRTLTIQEGFFTKATDTINYTFGLIGEMFTTLGAWIQFVWVIPGMIGWFLKGYIGAFLTYFIVKHLIPFT